MVKLCTAYRSIQRPAKLSSSLWSKQPFKPLLENPKPRTSTQPALGGVCSSLEAATEAKMLQKAEGSVFTMPVMFGVEGRSQHESSPLALTSLQIRELVCFGGLLELSKS